MEHDPKARELERAAERQAKLDAVHITHQIRSVGGLMTYGLKCKDVVIRLNVSPRATDADPGAWKVEARAKRPMAEDVVAAEWGATRIEALRACGRAWDACLETHGLDMFDWEAVAKVLQEVRAL